MSLRPAAVSACDARARAWVVPALLALFAAGIPTDNLLVRYAGSASMIGFPLALAAAGRVLTTGQARPPPAAVLWLTAFTGWSLLSVFWGHQSEAVDLNVKTRLQLLVLVWMGWQAAGGARETRALLAGYLAGCAIDVAESWRVLSSGGVVAGYARYYAEGFNPNHMAVTLAFGIPMATYLAVSGTRRSYLALGYVPLSLAGIALTGSRSGAVTASVAIAASVVWLMGRSRAAFGWSMAALVAGIAAIGSWIPEESWSRLFTVRAEIVGGSLGDRRAIWLAGFSVFLEHPVLGVGIGGFGRMVSPILGVAAVAHNTPLSVATETGLIGLALLLAVPASLVWSTRRAPHDRRAFVAAMALTWLVGTAAGTWEEDKQSSFVFLAGAAVAAFERRRASGGADFA